MSREWYIEHKGKTLGPISSTQLKQVATTGKITPETKVRLGEDGDWTKALKVHGLFNQIATTQPTQAPLPVPVVIPAVTQITEYRPCPICGESITQAAIKCRHCNEFLDGRPKEQLQAAAQPAMAFAAMSQPMMAPVVNVTQVTNVVQGGGNAKRWSPFVAALLSFILPGLGQIYKGQLINGFVWFIIVAVGYIAFIIPGLVLHLCCVLGAATGDPYR